MDEITLTINGKNISCRAGTSILNAALDNGFSIPTLCHHPHLEPFGACRICIVEDQNSGRIMASCVTPAASDMAIKTDSPTIHRHRTNIIRLIMANHPESCIVCNQGNRCELRKVAAELGVGMIDLYPMPHYMGLEEANPFIIRDLTKCILCGKCIRADHELVMVGAIDYNLRGFRSRPATVHEMPLERSGCTFCGTCVSICPTGALVTKNRSYVGSPQEERPTICGFCGTGCSLVMGSVDGRIVDVNPSHEKETINRSTLCVRGHFAHDFLNVPERLSRPLIRKNHELSPSTWSDAVDFVGSKLLAIKKDSGPQSIAFLGSSKCTNEENYLFQKLARTLLETNNIDNGGYLSGRPLMYRPDEGSEGSMYPKPLKGLEQAEAILVIGANPVHSLPVVGYYLKRATRMKRIPMIIFDPLKTELLPFSSLWLPLAPHSDFQLINGLSSILFKRKAYDPDFVSRFTEGFEQYGNFLSSLDLEKISSITGLDMGKMEEAAGLLAGKKIAFIVGHGVLQQRLGNQVMDALFNLSLMTGSMGGEGKGFYFLAAENNEIGAWDMGCTPDSLPGRQSLKSGTARKYWERAWKVRLSPDPGLNPIRMVEEAEKGNLRALYVMGENPLRSLPQPERVRKAFQNLEFLVVQDILENETTDIADVVLPGAAFSEKEGSFTNLEGRIQSFKPVVSPPGEARPDWEILDLLCSRMGSQEQYSSVWKIRSEISHKIPIYAELERSTGECWTRGESMHLKLFHPDGKGQLIPFTVLTHCDDEATHPDYPFRAIIGSERCHLGSGTRTGYSERIRDFAPRGDVEVSPENTSHIGIQDGDIVRISSPHGSIERTVKLKGDMSPEIIFIPKAFQGNDSMNLIELRPLDGPDSQGYREVPVKIEKS